MVTERGSTRVRDGRATVALVDDQPIWVAALARVLVNGGLDVVGAASSADAALELIELERPAGLVTSLELPNFGIEPGAFIGKVRQSAPRIRIVGVSAHATPFSLAAAAAAGADAYVAKTRDATEFAAEVRECIAGGCSSRARVTGRRRLDGLDLTDREAEILTLVASGFTNAEIATRLFVTTTTVKFHLVNAYRKLGVSNRTRAVRVMYEHGVVQLPLDRSA
jgi:DNA-binding NarL/FixJ family response regulator